MENIKIKNETKELVNSVRWIIGYLNRYPQMFYGTIVLSMIEILLFASPTLFISKIIELLMDNAQATEIILWIGYMTGVIVIQAFVFYVVATLNEIHAHRVTTDMTSDLFTTLQERPLYYHDGMRIGDVMARATGDTRMVNIGLSPAVRFFIQIVTLFISSLGVFFTVNWKMSLPLLLSFPLYGYLVVRYGKKLGPESTAIRSSFGELTALTHEAFLGISEVKSYVYEEQIIEKFSKRSEENALHVRKFGVLSAVYPPQLLMALNLGVTAVLGIILMNAGELTFPQLVIFVGLITILQFMGRRIKSITTMLMRMIASAERLQEVLEDNIVPLHYGTKVFHDVEKVIEFRDVSFRYSEDRPWTLRNVSLRIEAGETVAIVGGPGSGKSTFTKLLLRLYDPVEGSVLLDDLTISDYENFGLRSRMASIEQDVFLFSDTIRGNIAFGKSNASDEEIRRVAKLARADQFIKEFTDGYETIVGERGVTLSGGQKQRIAIARALLMDPAVLIMDDASSALDSETEYEIQQAIKQLLRTRTSVIITHRLSIIAEADKVVVFEEGGIVAVGRHQDLLRNSIQYRRLFESLYELPPLEMKT